MCRSFSEVIFCRFIQKYFNHETYYCLNVVCYTSRMRTPNLRFSLTVYLKQCRARHHYNTTCKKPSGNLIFDNENKTSKYKICIL